ncbi:MAG: general secretion pathway protein GspK [Nitrospirae bacterium]|nr:general secretion pathway protein GspK [Nitrospirota bacterium]
MKRDHLKTEHGIALLLVLWVLMGLTVLALTFSYLTRTEALGTLSFRNSVEAKFLAEAGIERAAMEVFYRNANKNMKVAEEGKEIWRTDGTAYRGETANGYYSVSLTDEGGKVDINRTPEVILKNLFINSGIKQEDADIIVDSIQDWRDGDDLHRLNGAESDYYMSLTRPYKARNADFETMEELLLVKGVTASILYGGEGRKGIIDLLTVHSKTGKINLNAAPKDVLTAIPGMSPELADAVIANRNAQPPLGPQEIIGGAFVAMAQYVDLAESTVFTVESAGGRTGEKAGYAIRAKISIEPDNRFRYLYYKSPVMTDNVGDKIN